jgi:hypothetical protein
LIGLAAGCAWAGVAFTTVIQANINTAMCMNNP